MQAHDRDRLKAYLPHYLAQRGIEPGKAFHCLNPAHPDRHPSMRYDPRREAVHCFSCGVDYDLLDLVGIDYGLESFPEKQAKAEELAGMVRPPLRRYTPQKTASPEPDPSIASYLRQCQALAGDTDYFARRGIGDAVVQKFRLGFDPAFSRGTGGDAWQAVILPTGPDSYTARNTDPEAGDKHRIRKKGEAAFLGFQEAIAAYSEAKSAIPNETSSEMKVAPSWKEALTACSEAKSANPDEATSETEAATGRIACTEGEFDALSLWEVGQPAISLGSVANVGRFLRQLGEAFPEADGSAARPVLLIALDNDEAGRRASAELLEGARAQGFRAFEVDVCCGAKDPNAALLRDRAAFRAAVAEAAQAEQRAAEREKKAYLSNSSAAHLQAFLGGIAASVDTEAVRTGFPALDAQLDGGLYEGLYIIGAISSLGKTTLLLQLADQLAQQGKDVLIFSLEMARNELMAKSISRHTLDICLAEQVSTSLAKTARGITTGKRYPAYNAAENAIIRRAIEAYGAYAEHLFIHEGMGDIGAPHIREAVRRHIQLTGNTPVVIVDYLQILSPHNERATDKQNIDRAVLELKRISRDFKLPVLGISSFNRANYSARVTMEAFKESGAIEYSSDVLIGLQLEGAGKPDFDAQAAKQENPRKVELVILKNRNGPAGGRLTYRYYPLFNAFVERAMPAANADIAGG